MNGQYAKKDQRSICLIQDCLFAGSHPLNVIEGQREALPNPCKPMNAAKKARRITPTPLPTVSHSNIQAAEVAANAAPLSAHDRRCSKGSNPTAIARDAQPRQREAGKDNDVFHQ